MEIIKIIPPSKPINTSIKLVSSKSESNRALIIQAVSPNKIELTNLSDARDTQTLQKLLNSDDEILDVLDAGTTMRFLTAYIALSGKHKILTGTPRMCERPIGHLVDALRSLGAKIDYLKKDGYPPLKTGGFFYSGKNHIKIKGDVSSQYISALLMTAPLLPEGLIIEIEGKINSKPYIDMTLQLMAHFGVFGKWENNYTIKIEQGQTYVSNQYEIESDWSGSSYWFSIVALSPFPDTHIQLHGLKENSLQGDKIIMELMNPMGVQSEFTPTGLSLRKKEHINELHIDFNSCPDLAQTLSTCAAGKGIRLHLSGLDSLRIKETDRIRALQNELKKIGSELVEATKENFVVKPIKEKWKHLVCIETYDDHRMAMAFAPLSFINFIAIKDPKVVNKSYPTFWEHLQQAGFNLTQNTE
jgi:3-phosphoshikimate 1-carboxyvinyltransferase